MQEKLPKTTKKKILEHFNSTKILNYNYLCQKRPNIFENLRKKKQGNNFDAEADVKNSSKTEELKVLWFLKKLL